jgi:hypothetical protein
VRIVTFVGAVGTLPPRLGVSYGLDEVSEVRV